MEGVKSSSNENEKSVNFPKAIGHLLEKLDSEHGEWFGDSLFYCRFEDIEAFSIMKKQVEESGLQWNKREARYPGMKSSSSKDDIDAFFKKNSISDPEHKLAIICLMLGGDDDAEELQSQKYQPFSKDELDPKNSRIGKLMSSLSIDPNECLDKIKNPHYDRHSYSRETLYFKKDKLAKALILYFMEKGDGVVKKSTEEFVKKITEQWEAEEKEEQEKKAKKIKQITGGIEVSPVTMKAIEENPHPYDGGIKVVDKDTLVVWEGRQSHSGGSGVAMYSDLSVYVNGHKQTKSFQWRDAYSSGNDNFGLRINKVTEAKSVDKGGKIEVIVTTDKGQEYIFEFDKKEVVEEREKLSSEAQEAFKKHFEDEVTRLMNQYNEWYKSTPKIPSARGEVRYIEPRIVKKEISEYGFGVIQIERQIDHKGEKDFQMMNHLFIVKPNQPAQEIAENHGYQYENKGQLSIVSVNGIDGTVEYSVDGENKIYKI